MSVNLGKPNHFRFGCFFSRSTINEILVIGKAKGKLISNCLKFSKKKRKRNQIETNPRALFFHF